MIFTFSAQRSIIEIEFISRYSYDRPTHSRSYTRSEVAFSYPGTIGYFWAKPISSRYFRQGFFAIGTRHPSLSDTARHTEPDTSIYLHDSLRYQ